MYINGAKTEVRQSAENTQRIVNKKKPKITLVLLLNFGVFLKIWQKL